MISELACVDSHIGTLREAIDTCLGPVSKHQTIADCSRLFHDQGDGDDDGPPPVADRLQVPRISRPLDLTGQPLLIQHQSRSCLWLCTIRQRGRRCLEIKFVVDWFGLAILRDRSEFLDQGSEWSILG